MLVWISCVASWATVRQRAIRRLRHSDRRSTEPVESPERAWKERVTGRDDRYVTFIWPLLAWQSLEGRDPKKVYTSTASRRIRLMRVLKVLVDAAAELASHAIGLNMHATAQAPMHACRHWVHRAAIDWLAGATGSRRVSLVD